MLPLLEAFAYGKGYHFRGVTAGLADRFALTEPEREELHPAPDSADY